MAGSCGVAVVAFDVLVDGGIGSGDAGAGFQRPVGPVNGKGFEQLSALFQYLVKAVDLVTDLGP